MDIYAKRTMNLGKVLSGIKTRMNKVDRILYRFHQNENENAMAWRRVYLNGYPDCMVKVAMEISGEIDQMYREWDIPALRREWANLNLLYDSLYGKYNDMLFSDVRIWLDRRAI